MKKLIPALFALCMSAYATSPAKQALLDSRSFELKVSQGAIAGWSSIDKFGVNHDIDSGPEDVWEHGGEYVYDSTNTAPIAYLSSSSASDTNIIVSIQGLDIDGYLVTQTVTNDGQNVTELGTHLWRVFRMENNSDDGNDISGTIYCHIDPAPTDGVPDPLTNTRAIIYDGNNQTLMALYTVPRGYVGFLYRGEVGMHYESASPATSIEYAHCHYESRRYGKLFKVKKSITCISGGVATYQDYRSFPDIIPALTDVKISAVEVSESMGLWATFDILLVKESEFSATYLQKIGQPGY